MSKDKYAIFGTGLIKRFDSVEAANKYAVDHCGISKWYIVELLFETTKPSVKKISDPEKDAQNVLPKYLTMIESDLMKVSHYLKDGVKVAIVAENKELSEKLAEHYVAADELSKEFQKLTRKIVD